MNTFIAIILLMLEWISINRIWFIGSLTAMIGIIIYLYSRGVR